MKIDDPQLHRLPWQLAGFITLYAQGNSFYRSVREARGEDVDKQQQHNSSLSDRSLNNLLKHLEKYSPKIIGIDTYLDRKIDPKYQSIEDNLKSGKLVAVCKINDRSSGEQETKPPASAELFGFGDTLADSDGTMRRHLLSMDAQPGACSTP